MLDRARVLPPAPFVPFVHHFWSARWDLRAPFIAEALPHPSANIVVERTAGVTRAEIVGVRTARYPIRLNGAGQIFGIAFRAAAFELLRDKPMASLTERALPIEDVFGIDGERWIHEILTAPSIGLQIAIAGAFLLPRLRPLRPEVIRIRDLVERLAVDRSILRVEEAAEAIHLDVRTLERRFRQYVGVSPKWVIRRYRLHEAAAQLKGAHPPALAELAASLGYADQAHFARDFKRTVGQTPRAFSEHSTK